MADIIIEGDTTVFRLTASKDDAVWDITGGTVTLRLRAPDGTSSSNSADVTDGPAGEAEFVTTTSTLGTPGDWARQWTVSKGGVVLSSPRIEFRVLPLLPDLS